MGCVDIWFDGISNETLMRSWLIILCFYIFPLVIYQLSALNPGRHRLAQNTCMTISHPRDWPLTESSAPSTPPPALWSKCHTSPTSWFCLAAWRASRSPCQALWMHDLRGQTLVFCRTTRPPSAVARSPARPRPSARALWKVWAAPEAEVLSIILPSNL